MVKNTGCIEKRVLCAFQFRVSMHALAINDSWGLLSSRFHISHIPKALSYSLVRRNRTHFTYGETRRVSRAVNKSLLLSFWTCPSSGFLQTRKHNVSETGSVSVFRRGVPTLQKNQKLAFPQGMPEQKKFNHWKQGDYKHLTAGRVHGM
jgi:hypothetical protein